MHLNADPLFPLQAHVNLQIEVLELAWKNRHFEQFGRPASLEISALAGTELQRQEMYVVKKDVTADGLTQETLSKVLEQVQFLEKNLEIVHATASCVEFALSHQDCEFDRAIALCVRQNIVNDLHDLGEDIAKIMIELGEKPTWLNPEVA